MADLAYWKSRLAHYDKKVIHLYVVQKWSTHRIAKMLNSSQGKVARSLRRTNTPRRTISAAMFWAAKAPT